MNEILQELFNSKLILELTGVVCIAILIAYLARRGLDYLRRAENPNAWVRIFAEVFFTPSLALIGGYGVLVALQVLVSHTEVLLHAEQVVKLRTLFIILTLAWLLFRWKDQMVKRFYRKLERKDEQALISLFDKVSTITIVIVAGVGVLDVFGVPLQALLAFGGLGGLAVSWAAKDMIANFFGGLMIFVNRPFVIDDWIKSTNKGFEGVVEDIGWYMTRIRSFERRPMYIPNALITDAIIENPGRMYNRRIKANIGVRYQDVAVVSVIIDDVEKMLQEHPEIAQDQTLMVHFTEFGPYSLEINVYCFTVTTDWAKWRSVQQDVFLKIADIIQSHDAEIAFPTQSLLVEKMGG